ncbi:MAG: ral secretion pathway protein GspE [Chitinophagaceae bacterium]|nr:ral secretion pathway protein GspE [Chitinophagaceae bacterium]
MDVADAKYVLLKADVVQLVTPEQAWHYRIIPVQEEQGQWLFYMDEKSFLPELSDELEILLGLSVRLEKKESDIILNTLNRYYRQDKKENKMQAAKAFEGKSDDFLKDIIGEAKRIRSSDIHIETYQERCRVRMRIDGLLVERYVLTKEEYPSLINKIKIMSNLDIAEKRLPQDGRIFFNEPGSGKFDIRVSVLPTLHGEKAVLRLLSNDATNIDINKLGFAEEDLENYLEGVKRPEGMVLISGPTGSGKTTTLYATLKLLNNDSRNITTIEDPIEYTLEGINQVQLRENIGLNFGSTLRTFLRQDPNIIMVGEIRDPDTASMAIRTSLTGHLVLSTIHTNSAWGTISRLVDMGVAPFLVATTLNTSVAQRLIRLLCPNCKKEEQVTGKIFPKKFKPYREVSHHFVAVGCNDCYHTGYKGRKAVYEVIPIDEELAEVIKSSNFAVGDLLKKKGIKTLSENAFELFEQGQTTMEEIYPLLINF